MTVFEKFLPRQGEPSLALPVALLAVAFLVAIGLQTMQLVHERGNLTHMYEGQEPAVQQTLLLRNSIDAFAGDTAALADKGDPSAKQVVDALHSQNINIRNSAAAAPAAH
jgi:hypothetical protein